jgi:serine protease AprX
MMQACGRKVSLAAALVLSCGSAGSFAAEGAPTVRVVSSRGGYGLSLGGGAVFHTASGAVLNPRTVPVPGTPTVLVTWEERGADGVTRPMYAISLDGRTFNTVQAASYVIELMYGSFDPLRSVPPVPAGLSAGAENELFIVQYVTQPLPSMQAAVTSAGGTIERYLPQLSQVVRMTPEARARVAALPFVRWVGAYHPAYRLSPAVFASAVSGGGSDATARYSIETMRAGPGQQQALSALVASLGGTVNVVTPDQFRMEATLTPAQLAAVCRRNEVNFIDPWLGPGGTDMDMIRKIGGAVPILSDAGFLGQGVRGEVFDTECRNTHQGFQSPAPIKHSSAWGNAGLHGSACYGINFAKWSAQPNATGMCPEREQGIFFYYPEATSFGGGTSRLTLNTQATDPNGTYKSSYQTSSVGNAQITTYSTISAETDDYLFKVDYLSCQSQSNTGSQLSRPEAWAKNILSVGGIDHKNTLVKTDDTSSGASFGPASDGRTKPDMAHSYLDIFTTWGDSDTGTTQFSGTSGATPITAGHFGLLMQMWHQSVWTGFGGASSVFLSRPRSATAKALMINTAYRYTWTGTAPPGEPVRPTITREIQGWGMADVGNMYNLRSKTFIVNETDLLTPLATKTYNLYVPAGQPNFNVTMVYKDPPGNPASQSQHRVNNLDLKVTSPTGTVYWGNNGLTKLSTPTPTNVSASGGNANTKDTVENVFVRDPASGGWKVEVIGAEIVQDGYLGTPGVIDAGFGLVVTGVEPLALTISLPNGVPDLLAPGVANQFSVKIEGAAQNPVPGSAKLHYRMSGTGEFAEAPLSYQGGTSYVASLTPPSCGSTPQFYITASGDGGGTATSPAGAPTQYYTAPVGTEVAVVSDNFQNDNGWTVENQFVQDGWWERAVPAGNGLAGDPLTDYDGSGKCWLTGPAVNQDVDGGPTILTSPAFNLSNRPNAKMSFARWHYTNEATSSDNLVISISNDNGASWTQVESVKSTTTGWVVKKFRVADFVPTTAQVRLRLSIADDPNNSITEAALDAFKITDVVCIPTCYPDCNGDGILNLADFGCFQTKFATGNMYSDCNADGVLNLADFGCFQTKFATGCP